jgi:hypothetical protein
MGNKIILISAMFLTHVLFAMEYDPKILIFDLVARSYLSDHRGICCVASINKAYHEYVLSQADQRNNLLPRFPAKSISFGAFKHPYGSVYCCAYKQTPKSKQLVLSSRYLGFNGKSQKKGYRFKDFISPLPCKSPPFLNQGKLYFYGFGEMAVPYSDGPQTIFKTMPLKCIIRYGLDRSRLQCRLGLHNTRYGESMHYFLDYPFLLEAILNSSRVTIKKNWIVPHEVTEEYLEFSLDEVTLPDNYTEQKDFPSLHRAYAADNFDHLPGYIRQAIIKRYAEQGT